jgi:hypothetical protein
VADAQLSGDEARELESHLTASCDDLIRRGLSAEEAFWVARQRLGSPSALGAEFAKMTPGRFYKERGLWFTAGVTAGYACTSSFSLFSTVLTKLLPKSGVQSGSLPFWTLETSAFLLMIALLVGVIKKYAMARNQARRVLSARFPAPLGFALVALVSGMSFGLAWVDSRLVSSTTGDGLGAMLFAGCEIERVSFSLMNALFVTVLSAAMFGLDWWMQHRNETENRVTYGK